MKWSERKTSTKHKHRSARCTATDYWRK